MAANISDIINNFIDVDDVKEAKNTLWDMYNNLMMSDVDLPIEARKEYTALCLRIVDVLNNILKAHKELSKEFGRSKKLPPS